MHITMHDDSQLRTPEKLLLLPRNLNNNMVLPLSNVSKKCADGLVNSVDSDQTVPDRSNLIWF